MKAKRLNNHSTGQAGSSRTGGLGALTWALTSWSSHQGSASARVGLSIGAVLFIALLLIEHRRGALAMMPLTLFASRSFVGLTLLTLLLYGDWVDSSAAALFPHCRRWIQPTCSAGFALLPLSSVMGTMSGAAGRPRRTRIGPAVAADCRSHRE